MIKQCVVLLVLISLVAPTGEAQLSDIALGDTYAAAKDKIHRDALNNYYQVMESKDRIRVAARGLGTGTDDILHEFRFKKDKLYRIYMIHANGQSSWQWFYRTISATQGEPHTVTSNGVRMKYWDTPNVKSHSYFYFASHEWFQKECLYWLQTYEEFGHPTKSR